jgi:hypothetical protein
MVLDGASRDLNIIERDGVIRELLITFVPFACDQYNVARLARAMARRIASVRSTCFS